MQALNVFWVGSLVVPPLRILIASSVVHARALVIEFRQLVIDVGDVAGRENVVRSSVSDFEV